MNTIYVYEKSSGRFIREERGSTKWALRDIKPTEDFTFEPLPNYEHIWQRVDNKWVELLPINNPNMYYGDEYEWDKAQNKWVIHPELDAYKLMEDQSVAWENIKQRRYEAVTSGVYVESVDSWFHTDEVSVTSYSTIAGMIALNNYEPVQWKTMDNTWILLTIPIFKELQTAISQKTNANYAIAEQHKSDMMKSDNPLEYDFSTGWV